MKYMNLNGEHVEDDLLTSKVIGIAIEVHKELGTGFDESVYHRSMEIALADAGLYFVSQAPLSVYFRGHIVGSFKADLVVEGGLLLELKAVDNLPLSAEVQTVNYLKASGLPIGLILNFGSAPLQVKRKFRDPRPIDPNLRLRETTS